MKRVISLAVTLIILVLSVASASALTHPDNPYIELANDIDDNLSVTGYTGSDPVLTIPEMAYNKYITRFEEKALIGNKVVQSLIMNDRMTNVRQRAFYQCENLSYVYYSKRLQVIEKYAFAYDAQLQSAFLRNTDIRQLGNNAYYNCANLEYVSLPDTLESIDGAAFEKTAIRTLVIPSKTTSISARCFANNSKLEKIYVPASIDTIGSNVFYNSPNVTVYTPEGSNMQTYCENNNIKFETLSEENFPSHLLGDTNGDDKVNINDVTIMQFEIAGYKMDFYPDNCDFNGDCKLNINDATDVQLRLAGVK